MMLTSKNLRDYLSFHFPQFKIYNGSINRSEVNCIGIYTTSGAPNNIAIGGLENTSYGTLPISILIHWGEDAEQCSITANEIYEKLYGISNIIINDKRIINFNMLDPCPINIARDKNNICEMVIRINIVYER